MATKPTGEIIVAEADYQRGDLFKEIDHDRVANAIRFLSYARLHYYDSEYQVFLKLFATHRATWSFEDTNFILALFDFEDHFRREFLGAHPEATEGVDRLSPKQMVDLVDTDLLEETRARRDAARKIAHRAVANAIKQGALKVNEVEKERLVRVVEKTIRAAASEAESVKAFEERMEASPLPIPIKEDPATIQQLLFGDKQSSSEVLDRTIFSSLPNKRALHTIITSLPIKPEETRAQFLDRAESVARVAMAASGLSETPITHAEPSKFVSAILEATGNRTAIKALGGLAEQTKNIVSLMVVAKAWEDAVDVVTKRAGGVIALSFEPILREANKQPVDGSIKQVASLVGDVLNPLLGRTFERLVELDALNLVPPEKTKALVSSPQTLLLLAAYTWKPEGVWFERPHVEGPTEAVAWTLRWATDSAFGKIVNRAAKSGAARGFFGKILPPVLGFLGIRVGGAAAKAAGGAATKVAGGVVTRGVAALLTKLGLSALAGVFTGGTSLLAQAAIWVGGKVLGGLWRAGAWFFSARWLTSLLGFGSPSPGAPKKWYEQDWVPIVIIIAIAVLLPMFGVMMQITTQNSALVTSFEASALAAGGPYTEVFPEYNGPFPSGPTAVSACAVDHKNLTQRPFDSGGIGTHSNTCAYDFNAPSMSSVVATHDGCVAFVRTNIENNKRDKTSYGNVVILAGKAPDGSVFYSRYAHLAQNTSSQLSKGQCIAAGTPIGNVDNTGNSTGTHLHLEFLDENMGHVTQERCFSTHSLPGCTQ